MSEKEKEILSVSERKGLQEEKKSLENTLSDIEREKWGQGTRGESIDKDGIKRQIKHLDRAIHEGTPQVSSGVQKDKMLAESREIEEKLKEGMPTYDEMQAPEKNPGAVMKNFQWERKNAVLIQRWKRLQRTLAPHDPTVSNVERFREKKRKRWV
jgi:hypothetical protein